MTSSASVRWTRANHFEHDPICELIRHVGSPHNGSSAILGILIPGGPHSANRVRVPSANESRSHRVTPFCGQRYTGMRPDHKLNALRPQNRQEVVCPQN
jgi:hypothetical protein